MSSASENSIFDLIPSAEEPPAGALPSLVAPASWRWSRRRVVGMAFGAVTGAALGALNLLPMSRPRSALAVVYTTSWSDCHGYANASTVCTPSSAYYGSDNCTAAKWHRDDGASGTCYSINYTSEPSTCGGRNAWRWNGGSTSSLHRKCSDGHYYAAQCGHSPIDRFSICRSAI